MPPAVTAALTGAHPDIADSGAVIATCGDGSTFYITAGASR